MHHGTGLHHLPCPCGTHLIDFSGFSGAYRLLPGGGNQRAFELRRIEGGVSRVLQPAPDKI